MPLELINFAVLLFVVVLVFVVIKRPLYEAMAVAAVVILIINGRTDNAVYYFVAGAKSSILFTIVLFLVFSAILKQTGVIDESINIILAAVGRVPGGAGLISIVSSAFMGAMSGSGPGNIAATGSITIPLMKKAGYPKEFAAGVAMAGSCLGPIIPPSATILAAFSCVTAVAGFSGYSFSDFWMVMYRISALFLLQRIVQLYIMYGALGIKTSSVADLPDLRTAWAAGWKSFMLVPVILIPFLLDAFCSGMLARLLGETAARNYSGAVLFITPAIASSYCLLISRKKTRITMKSLARGITGDLKPIVSLVSVLYFSYVISEILADTNTISYLETGLISLNFSWLGMVVLLLAVSTVLGMFMSGSALIPLLGPVYISILSFYGVSPVTTAAVLPVLFVSLGQMTPPFAVCMFAAIGIAGSDFKKTSVHAILWSASQILLTALIILNIIPVV